MKTNAYFWLLELLSQFLEGISDNFLAVMAGSAIGTTATATPPVKVIACTVATSGLIYAASFVKQNPSPWSYVPAPKAAALLAAEPIKPVATPPAS